MSDPMNQDQFDKIMSRFDAQDAKYDARFKAIEDNMVRKTDLYQAIFTVQGFMIAIVVGVVVVLNATIGFG